METFKKTLNDLIPKLNGEINQLLEESTNPAFISGDSNMNQTLNVLEDLEVRYKEIENRSLKYNNW